MVKDFIFKQFAVKFKSIDFVGKDTITILPRDARQPCVFVLERGKIFSALQTLTLSGGSLLSLLEV